MHNINKDTICPEDCMIEDLAQFHLFLKFPVTIVLLRLAVGQVSQCSLLSYGGVELQFSMVSAWWWS